MTARKVEPTIGDTVTIYLTDGGFAGGTITYLTEDRIGLGLNGGLIVNGIVVEQATGPAGWIDRSEVARIRRSRGITV